MDKFELVWVTNRRLSENFFADVDRAATSGIADKILLRESDLSEREYENLARKTLEIIAKRGSRAELVIHSYAAVAKRLGVRELHLPFAKFTGYMGGDLCGSEILGANGDRVSKGVKERPIFAKFSEDCLRKPNLIFDKIKNASDLSSAKFNGSRADGQGGEHALNFTKPKFSGLNESLVGRSNSAGISFAAFDRYSADLAERELNLTASSLPKFCGVKNKSIIESRINLTEEFNVGVSAHSLKQALFAQSLGAAYVVAGHIFDTPSHIGEAGRGLEFLRRICANLDIKTYAIGGINFENLNLIKDAGAAGAYMMRGFLG